MDGSKQPRSQPQLQHKPPTATCGSAACPPCCLVLHGTTRPSRLCPLGHCYNLAERSSAVFLSTRILLHASSLFDNDFSPDLTVIGWSGRKCAY